MSPRVAVVTGARRGLGAALAAALVARRFSVAGCATTAGDAPALDLYRAVDVSVADDVDDFAAEVADHLGPIDLWINNAAVVTPVGPVRDARPEDWRRAVDVNVLGVVAGIRAFSSARRSHEAVLVNVVSRAARGGWPGLGAYSATKAAVVSLTQTIAEEERDRGLRAHAVLPPSMETDMQRLLLGQDPVAYPGVTAARRRRAEGRIERAGAAAERILAAVLDGADPDTVIDLTGD